MFKPESHPSESQAPVTLSLCMIVKDEAQNLPRCLQSVQGIVDEIIVVDTGSSDQTVEVAQSWGAAVYHEVWRDDFAAARNKALTYATGMWILVLDADEVLLEPCLLDLRRVMQNPDCLAVTLLRHELGTQQNPYTLICRLFRRHPALRFERPYHESVDESITTLCQTEPHWRIQSLPTPAIAHDGYHPDQIVTRNKASRAERIMAQHLAQNPQDAYICSKLGGLYMTQGQTDKGVQILTQGLSQPANPPAVLYELHYHLGMAYRVTGPLHQAQHHYEQALQTELADVLKIAASVNLAALYTDQGEWDAAQPLLEQVVLLQPDLAIAHYNLGLIYKAQGQYLKAIQAYQSAIQLNPQSAEAYQNLGVVHFKMGQIPQSIAAFRQAIHLHECHNPPEALRLRDTLKDLGFAL